MLVYWRIMPLAKKLSSKFHSCPRSFRRFSANCSFFGQSFCRGHYLPIYQPPEGLYLLNIPKYINHSRKRLQTPEKILLWNFRSWYRPPYFELCNTLSFLFFSFLFCLTNRPTNFHKKDGDGERNILLEWPSGAIWSDKKEQNRPWKLPKSFPRLDIQYL